MEVMEVDSAVNKRLPLVSLPYVFRLYFQCLYLFRTSLSSLCMVVTTRTCNLCLLIVFYKLNFTEAGVGGRGQCCMLLCYS